MHDELCRDETLLNVKDKFRDELFIRIVVQLSMGQWFHKQIFSKQILITDM